MYHHKENELHFEHTKMKESNAFVTKYELVHHGVAQSGKTKYYHLRLRYIKKLRI
jgi:hypothetical protein